MIYRLTLLFTNNNSRLGTENENNDVTRLTTAQTIPTVASSYEPKKRIKTVPNLVCVNNLLRQLFYILRIFNLSTKDRFLRLLTFFQYFQ